jgi:squalene-hopene/tetraprenyl-beta-curcumene cyclase
MVSAHGGWRRWVAVGVLWALGVAIPAAAQPKTLDRQLQERIKAGIDLGLKYLAFKQAPNGSWHNHPGTTALVVQALMESHRRYTEDDGPFVRKALAYLAGVARPDGAIYDQDLPNYNTAVAILAFQASKNPRYQPLVENAQQYLIASQLDEGKGYTREQPFYGAIGLGGASVNYQPDLDNLGFALAALKAAGVPATHPVWHKAVTFVSRSQNRQESNDQPWAGTDGGFVFRPGFSSAGGTASYASTTYVGLQSLLYANIGKEDPRVQAAFHWIRRHYTVEENPGLGQQALYRYYYFMAHALYAYGELLVVDATGTPHNWRQELAGELLLRQTVEGYWVNDVALWWEDNPLLATAFAVLALERILND